MSEPLAGSTPIHGHEKSVVSAHSWRTVENSIPYILPYLVSQELNILDVGCGPGSITIDLASRVPKGQVTGVDYADKVLEEARANARNKGCENVKFVAASVYELPFEDHTFDITHAHQLLQHVTDPVRALREMRRVTKPGGIVASRETDLKGFLWYPELPELSEWIAMYEQAARASGGEPNAGRRLRAWARKAGFDTDKVTSSAGIWCFANAQERQFWGGSWAQRVVSPTYVESMAKLGYERQILERMSQAWEKWAADDDAWFSVTHGQIVCRV